jgi:hypothetical protein
MGGAGVDGSAGGAGGAGLASAISGSSVTYAAGGAGGYDVILSANGTANTGNGGRGDGGNSDGSGSNGGSGIVILRVPNTYSATFSGGLTSSLSTAQTGYKTYTVTAGTGTVTFS